MKYLSCFLMILLLSTMSSCKFIKEKKIFGKKKAQQAELLAQQKMIREADSLRKIQEHLKAIENARLDSIRLAEETRLVQASKYNIIVGAFITPEYARAWADEYRKRGYDAKIIQMEGGRFELVAAESHESVGKAIQRLNQFRDTEEVDSWIYSRK
jgi:hypothetical protein